MPCRATIASVTIAVGIALCGCGPVPRSTVELTASSERAEVRESELRISSFEDPVSDLLRKDISADLGRAWVYPLAGPRQIPQHPSRLFGASRTGERPWECGRGHCGIDLGNTHGAVVYAMSEGVVVRAERRDRGRTGRFVRIIHANDFPSRARGGDQGVGRKHDLRTDYIHLDRIREDLRPGSRVRTGEPIGTVGRTGVKFSGPHLHFALAHRRGAGWEYIDPEPLLTQALLHEGARSLADLVAQSREQAILWQLDPDIPVGVLHLDVRDAHTGRYLDARVRATMDGAAVSGTRTRDGIVVVRGLPPGRWNVAISVPGYSGQQRHLSVDSADSHRAPRPLRVELSRGAELRGVVRDRDGERVAGARVALGGVSTRTDSSGRFHLRDVGTGRVELVAALEGEEAFEALELAPGDELVTLQLTLR